MLNLNTIFIIFSCFCTSVLNAGAVHLPLEEPVLQNSSIFYVRSTDSRYTMSSQKLETSLILKNLDSQRMDIEALYLSILDDYEHDNDNLNVSISHHFDSKKLGQTSNESLEASWASLSKQPHLLTVTSEGILPISENSDFLTLENNPLFQGHLNAVFSLQHMDLKTGDCFQLSTDSITWEYQITSISDKRIYYKVFLSGVKKSGQGQGFWSKENGLISQLELHANINGWSLMGSLSSQLQ